MLLEDMHVQEKLAQFNRERIPERVVHARGMGAKVLPKMSGVACSQACMLAAAVFVLSATAWP